MRLGLGFGAVPGGSTFSGAAIDKTPTAFTFIDQTDVALAGTMTSNAVVVAGTNESTAVSITGGTYSKNGGAYTSAAGTALPGDSFTVRHTSSASNSTATNTVLTIGGVSDTFTSTTLAGGPVEGPELLTNGDMSSSTGWTLNDNGGSSTATISGGKLTLSDPEGFEGPGASQAPALAAASTYRAAYTIDSIASGSVVVLLGAVSGTARTAAGAYSEDIVADGDDTFNIRAISGVDVVIDNASLKLLS